MNPWMKKKSNLEDRICELERDIVSIKGDLQDIIRTLDMRGFGAGEKPYSCVLEALFEALNMKYDRKPRAVPKSEKREVD